MFLAARHSFRQDRIPVVIRVHRRFGLLAQVIHRHEAGAAIVAVVVLAAVDEAVEGLVAVAHEAVIDNSNTHLEQSRQ